MIDEQKEEDKDMVDSQQNEFGDESSSNYTFGEVVRMNSNPMRIEMIGDHHEDIPSDIESKDSNGYQNI